MATGATDPMAVVQAFNDASNSGVMSAYSHSLVMTGHQNRSAPCTTSTRSLYRKATDTRVVRAANAEPPCRIQQQGER